MSPPGKPVIATSFRGMLVILVGMVTDISEHTEVNLTI
jgi:hypothetical protein